MDVKDFSAEFRSRIGDSSKSVPSNYIITYLNTALRRLARTDGMEKLFEFRTVYELAAINKDGTPSAAWDLETMGALLDIPKLRILKTGPEGVCEINPGYKEYDDFFDNCPLPEYATPGDPDFYTLEQIGSSNRLLFNRPPRDITAIDMKFSAFHPRIASENDKILINYGYCDALTEYVIILHKIETTDQSTARALYEDLDKLVAEIVELLAKRKGTLNYRRLKRSF